MDNCFIPAAPVAAKKFDAQKLASAKSLAGDAKNEVRFVADLVDGYAQVISSTR